MSIYILQSDRIQNKRATSILDTALQRLIQVAARSMRPGVSSRDNNARQRSTRRLQELERSMVHAVAQQGRIKALRFLHSKGLSLDFCGKNGDTPLHLSASEGQEVVVDWLVQNGANIHAVNRVWRTIYSANFS